MQSLDRSFFRPLKVYYDNACHTFVRRSANHKTSVGFLLNEAWGKAATIGTAINGFRACGIYPLDRSAIPDAAYAPSSVSELLLKTFKKLQRQKPTGIVGKRKSDQDKFQCDDCL